MAAFISQKLRLAGTWSGAIDRLELSYDDRFLRRKLLRSVAGRSVLVDLAQTMSLGHGDALELAGGELVEICAADEELLAISGENLVQLAWHIGNRHTPCQIEPDRLLIQPDPVIGHMLAHLGASVTPTRQAFNPEGGAYGHGRTHAHAHGHTAHDH
tara:strand:+ start:220 stop:690 length:471 start_codon:yes stop_codon:yes gene_type:complete